MQSLAQACTGLRQIIKVQRAAQLRVRRGALGCMHDRCAGLSGLWLQGRLPCDHPLNTMPQDDAWEQLSRLARLVQAIQHGLIQAQSVLYTAASQASVAAFKLSPTGSALAEAGLGQPPIRPVLPGATQISVPSHRRGQATGEWSPDGALYAFMEEYHFLFSQAPDTPAEVFILDLASRQVRSHTLPGNALPVLNLGVTRPRLAWSSCAQHLLILPSLGHPMLSSLRDSVQASHVHVLEVRTGAVAVIKVDCPGCSFACVWRTGVRSQLVCVCQPLLLKVLACEAGVWHCAAQLDLRHALVSVGALQQMEALGDPALALAVSLDGSKAVVAFGRSGTAQRVDACCLCVLVQLDPGPTLLGYCALHQDDLTCRAEGLCMGPGVCALSTRSRPDLTERSYVHVIRLSDLPSGQVLLVPRGDCPAFSPCGSYLAILRRGTTQGHLVSVLRVVTGHIVAIWGPSQVLAQLPLARDPSEPAPGQASLRWQPTGQLHVDVMMHLAESDQVTGFVQFMQLAAVLTF